MAVYSNKENDLEKKEKHEQEQRNPFYNQSNLKKIKHDNNDDSKPNQK